MILPFIRLAITFRDIHYYVAMPEVLSLSFSVFRLACQERLSGNGIVMPSSWSAMTYIAFYLGSRQSSLMITSPT